MRSDEQLDLVQFLQLLEKQNEVFVRMAIMKHEDSWTMQWLILTVAPDLSLPEWSCYDYGELAFFANQLSGSQIAAWVQNRTGEIDGYTFSIPELYEQVATDRFSSHARHSGYGGLWQPHTKYEVHSKFNQLEQGYKREPLVQDGCPSFPTVVLGVFKLLFDLDADPVATLPSHGVSLRIAHTDAWIEELELRTNSVLVTIKGQNISGVRLELTGSPDIRFDRKLTEQSSIEFPFPDGLPTKLWLLLSRGNRWLDVRELNQYGMSSAWNNVISAPPDLATMVAGVIARGESDQTEFKVSVPPHSERMLKTVAAFANGKGGMFIVGVENEEGEIKGLSGHIGREKDKISQMIRDKIHPEPKTQVEHCEVRGKTLIVITVEDGDRGPYGIGVDPEHLTYWVRRGSTTRRARQTEIRDAARKNPATDYP